MAKGKSPEGERGTNSGASAQGAHTNTMYSAASKDDVLLVRARAPLPAPPNCR